MNIKDIVKYDERSEAILNKRYEHKLQILMDKFSQFGPNNAVYLGRRQDILDEKEKYRSLLKEKNVPIRDEALLAGMAIQWAEANNYTSFTQAMKEVMIEAVSDDHMKTYDADMLKEDSRLGFVYEDISLEEAKKMYGEVHPYNPISDAIVKESLELYHRMLNPHRESDDNTLYFSDWKCTIKIDGYRYDIPIMVFKQLIAEYLGIKAPNANEWVKALKDIKLPDLDISWPKE